MEYQKVKLTLISVFISICTIAQYSVEKQFKGLNKKREFRVSVTGCNIPECNLEIDLTGMVVYDFLCNGNSIVCNPTQIMKNDTAVFIDLRFKNFQADSIEQKKITIHNEERLILRIEKSQGLKVKRDSKVYFVLFVNGETIYINSTFYKYRFCRKRVPVTTGIIKL